MSYSAVIAEDEKLSADLLEMILSEISPQIGPIDIHNIAHSGEEAIAAVMKYQPDILFLDINMPQGDGFAVVEAIRAAPNCMMPAIIFTTAHSRFAVRAFDVEAADYLLKPLSNERVIKAINKVMKTKALAVISPEIATEEAMIIKVATKDGAEFISSEHIDAMEASGDYIFIYTEKRKLMMRGTLRDYSQKLSQQNGPKFYQTHRSYLVNINSVQSVERNANGGAIILLNNREKIPLSRRYKAGLFRLLPDFL